MKRIDWDDLFKKISIFVMILVGLFSLIILYEFYETKKDYDCVLNYKTTKEITKECEKYFR